MGQKLYAIITCIQAKNISNNNKRWEATLDIFIL